MILVTGATGQNGGATLRLLSAAGVPVRALTRDPAKAAALASLPHVEVVAGDMARPETLDGPLRGVDRVLLISSSTPNMVEVQSNLIDAAAKAGVRHVVKLSGIFAALDSPFRFAAMHAQIERKLETSGLAFTHLRPGEFMTAYFRQAPNIVAKGMLLLPMAGARIASIDIGDVAAIAAKTLTEAGHEGRTYALTGPEALTMAEVAERLSRVAGKPIRYIDVPPEDAKKAQLAAGMPPYMADALAELFAERRKGVESRVTDTFYRLAGREPVRFETFAARHAAIFKGEAAPPRL